MTGERVRQLRLVVTATDYDAALRFYRDVLGMPEEAAFSGDGAGSPSWTPAGPRWSWRPAHADYVDEVEVGRRVAGRVRVAFEVDDGRADTDRSWRGRGHGGRPADRTPWDSLNARLDAPAGLHITVFTELA